MLHSLMGPSLKFPKLKVAKYHDGDQYTFHSRQEFKNEGSKLTHYG